ncbi:MAG: hypothetical protein ACFFCE_02960 [Promethearchaeota archaeon]
MSEEWKHAYWVSTLGKWAWVIGIINGIINIIRGFFGFFVIGLGIFGIGLRIWLIISGIIIILISFVIIKPKFSYKCAIKDWDGLYNWFLIIGEVRIPWMLLWGIIIEIFGYGWGGLPIIICSLALLIAGPKKYDWNAEKKHELKAE